MSAVAAPKPEKRKITPEMRKKAEDLVKKAKVQLAINHPFFAQIVLNRKIELSEKISTACVTPRGKITVGVPFASELRVQQGVFLLAHEAMHYAMLHGLRRAHRQAVKWNVACDAVINDLLQEAKVGEFIEGGIDMKGSKDKTSEKVYDELPMSPKGGKGKGKSGQGGMDREHSPGEGWDDLDNDDGDGDGRIDEAEAREIEQQVRTELAQAAQVAKQQGKLPAGLERMLDEIINPTTPWHILLEPFMLALVRADYSFKRPKKALISQGLYLPSHDQLPQMGPVVIAIDTSGSIGDEEIKHFLGHMNTILERCRPEVMYVMACDASVHSWTEVHLEDLPITPDMAKKKGMTKGGGGTSFKPPFKRVAKEGVEPDVFIYLTDMYGDFPDKDPGYPVIWLSISEVDKAPFGHVIEYQMDENR